MHDKIKKYSNELSRMEFNIRYCNLIISAIWFRALVIDGEYSIKRHKHSTYEVHIIKSEKCHVITDDGEYELCAGSTFVTPPGVYHQQDIDENGYVEYCLNFDVKLNIENADSDSIMIYNALQQKDFAVLPKTGRLEKYFEKALKEASMKEIGYRHNIEHIICMMINELARLLNKNEAVDTRQEGQSGYDYSRYKIIEAYVDDNLDKPLYASEIAKTVFLSEKQTGRIVKKFSSYGINEFIMLKRIERAKHFLKNSTYSIAEISEKSGFASAHYFSSCFKKRTGFSPGEYRGKK